VTGCIPLACIWGAAGVKLVCGWLRPACRRHALRARAVRSLLCVLRAARTMHGSRTAMLLHLLHLLCPHFTAATAQHLAHLSAVCKRIPQPAGRCGFLLREAGAWGSGG
jgi:hypothetical protein